jgi:hypothetical protein
MNIEGKVLIQDEEALHHAGLPIREVLATLDEHHQLRLPIEATAHIKKSE